MNSSSSLPNNTRYISFSPIGPRRDGFINIFFVCTPGKVLVLINKAVLCQVSGLVGRADLLAALFMLAAFRAGNRSVSSVIINRPITCKTQFECLKFLQEYKSVRCNK